MSISTDVTESRAELEVKKSKSQENSTLKTVLICGALLIPVFFLFFIIIRYGVDGIFWDELDFAEEYLEMMKNGNIFEVLYRQHSMHRLLFPKIIMYVSALITNYNTKVEMYIGAIYYCITYFALIKLTISKKIKNMTLSDALFSVLIGLCLFTVSQYENIIWGMQSAWFMISLGVVCTFWALSLYLKTEEKKYYVSMLIFATIACYSSLHGLAVWIALAVVIIGLIATKSSPDIKRWIPVAIIGIVEIVLYFCGLVKTNDVYSPDSITSMIVYYFQTIGSAFRLNIESHSDWLQCALGVLFFALAVSLIVFLIIKGKYKDFIGQIGIIVYSFGVDAMFTLGRGGQTVGVPSRYITCTVLAAVAVMSIIYKLLVTALHENKGKKCVNVCNSVIASVTTVAVIATMITYQSFDTIATNQVHDRNYVVNILQNYKDYPLASLQTVYPFKDYEYAYYKIGLLEKNHLSCFNGEYKLIWGETDTSEYTIVPEQANCDFLNGFSWSEDNKILYLNSWAIITASPMPSSNVLVKLNDKYYDTQNQISRPDVAEAFGNENYTNSGFVFQKNAEALNVGINTVNVLVISEDGKTAYETPADYIYKNDDGSMFRCDASGKPVNENNNNADNNIDTSELFAPEIKYSDLSSIEKPESPDINICIDSLTYNDGATAINGWVYDTKSNDSFEEVYLHSGNTLYRLRAKARDDVQGTYSLLTSDVGFTEQIHGEISEYSIVVKSKKSEVYYEYDSQTVNAINDSNHMTEYAEKYNYSDIVTDSISDLETESFIDRLEVNNDTTTIAGWLIDPDTYGSFEEVYLMTGDELFKLIPVERTDVQEKYGLSDANVGFGGVINEVVEDYSFVVKPYNSDEYYQVQVS